MKTNVIGLLAAAVLVVGCQRSTMQVREAEPFSVMARTADFRASTDPGSVSEAFGSSKASKATENAFQSGDRLGLYVTEGASSVVGATGNHSSNVPYRYDGAWRAAGALAGELIATTSYRATGYYPYKQGLSNATAIEHEVASDQSSAAGAVAGALEGSDFLVSVPSVITGVNATPQNPQTSLSFTHAMAKLIVTLTVPEELDGGAVSALTAIQFKGVRKNCVVNLATGGVLEPAAATVGDVLPRLTSSGGTAKGATVFYEAIVPPQLFGVGQSLVWLRFSTDQGDKELTYVIPTGGAINLATNQKYTLTLSSIADLAFVTEIPSHLLLDGLAHTDIEIKIKSKTAWRLTSPNGGWLKLKTAGGTYGYTVSGSGSAGDQTVYVDLAANTSALLARTAVLTLESTTDSKVRTTYGVNQNYFSYINTQPAWSPTSGASSQAVAAIDGNQLIRVTSDEARGGGAANWLKFASSATYGAGNPKDSLDVVGSLAANTLWLQASANNTAAARSTTVRYVPVDLDGVLLTAQTKSQTVTQAAPSVVVTPVALAAGPTALTDHTLFTVTAPAGVEWKLSDLGGADAAHFTGLSPVSGAVQTGTGGAVEVKVSASAVSLGEVKNAKLKVLYALAATTPLETADINISHGMFVSVSDASDWLDVSKMGDAKTITVGIVGAAAWTAQVLDGSDNVSTAVTVTPSTGGDQASVKLTWSPNVTASAKSNYKIKFFPTGYPDVNAVIKTGQLAGPAGVLVGGVVWATGNLVATNATAGAQGSGGCKIGAPADHGLYFQFGSLIGYKGGALANGGTGVGSNPYTGSGTQWWGGATAYSWANDAMVWPSEMTGTVSAWPSNNGSSAGDRNTVVNQWFFNYNTAPYSTAGQDIRGFSGSFAGDQGTGTLGTGRYAKWGIGDPCSYYLGDPWRLPTTVEQASITGKTGSSWIPWTTAGVTGRWATSGQTFGGVSGPGAWFGLGLNAGSGTPAPATNLFFPASGCRNSSSGSFYYVTTGGYCWSSSVYGATHGYNLGVHESAGVIPQNGYSRSYGFPVRCVASVP